MIYIVVYQYGECHRDGHKKTGIEEFKDIGQALKLRSEILVDHSSEDPSVMVLEVNKVITSD